MAFDFNALIAPDRAGDFLREHWERKPLHLCRGNAAYYDSLLTGKDLEDIISSADMRYPAIQLACNGSYFPAEAYTKNIKHGSEMFTGVPDLERIQSEYRSGTTVVLPALQRTWAPLRKLCAAIENELSHPVHANAYLTPGNSAGFSPHYDTHEVFVLQIGGRKRWQVFEPTLTLPHYSQSSAPIGSALPTPLLELELKQGDLLYLPRGFVHAASTSEDYSAHVTIGITVFTWVELISELVAASKGMVDFRTALPPGFAQREDLKQTLKEGLVQCMNQLRDNVDYDRLIETFKHRVRSGLSRSEVPFQSDVRVIGLQTRLKVPEADRYHILAENGSVILEFEGRKFGVPNHLRMALDDMCRRRSFRPGELSGPLDNNSKVTLARYLHAERFLTLAD